MVKQLHSENPKDTWAKQHALGKLQRILHKFCDKEKKGKAITINKDARKLIKGFYTSNQWEIDPSYGSYWKKSTDKDIEARDKFFTEMFGE
jgi:hypothetical protein